MSKQAGDAPLGILRARNFYYVCLACGLLCPAFFFSGFIAAGFLPPAKPWWSAETTAAHYQHHTVGARVGACLIMLSGMFYLPYSILISVQMSRIPNLPHGVAYLQLASAAAGVFTLILPGMTLALTAYRPHRSTELTQMLNDMFWIFCFAPWPTFLVQNWAFGYAVLVDKRPNPLFPKYVAILNGVVPLLFSPALGLHFVKSGVVAWNGVLTFWTTGVAFGLQFGIDTYCLFKAIRNESIDTAHKTAVTTCQSHSFGPLVDIHKVEEI